MNVFDPSALRRLESDTQSRAFVHTLVDTYQRMLGQRIERVTTNVDVGDVAAALDAALSLRVSSIMTGVTELADLATGIVEGLRADELASVREQAPLLPDAAARARLALDDYIAASSEEAVAQESSDSIR